MVSADALSLSHLNNTRHPFNGIRVGRGIDCSSLIVPVACSHEAMGRFDLAERSLAYPHRSVLFRYTKTGGTDRARAGRRPDDKPPPFQLAERSLCLKPHRTRIVPR